MTDLETLLRETFAAHEHLAQETSEPMIQRRSRSDMWVVIAAVAATIAVATGGVLALRGADVHSDPARPGTPTATVEPTPPDTRSEARDRADAQAGLLLTALARRFHDFPGGMAPAQAADVAELANLTTYLREDERRVVLSSSWTTEARDPSQVLEWFAQHPPKGLAADGPPRYVDLRGQVPREELVFVLPPTVDAFMPPMTLVQAVRVADGVGVRTTVYVPLPGGRVHPQLPEEISVATVNWGSDSVHVTDERDLRALAGALEQLELREPDLSSCWNITTDPVGIAFTAQGQDYEATSNGCAGWSVTRDGSYLGDLYDGNELLTTAKQLVVASTR